MMAGETKQAKDSKIRQLRDENGSLKARIEELLIATAPGNLATLEDSSKLKADIAVLNDSVKAKDTEIAQLQDSLTKSDAAFLEVTAELAKLNDRPVSDGMVLDFINNRLDEDTWAKIGTIKKFGMAPVEDSAELEDKKKEYRISKSAILTTKSSQSHYGKPVLRVTSEDGKKTDYGPGDLTGYIFEPEQTYGDVVAKILSGHSWNKENKWENDLMKAFLSQSPKYANVEDSARDAHNVEAEGSTPSPATKPEGTAPVADVESPGEKWWNDFCQKI